MIAGSAVIPPDTLRKIKNCKHPNHGRSYNNLGYQRKHVPGFPLISHPLYSILWKDKPLEWKIKHKEVVKTLNEELKTYQSLEPVQPHDLIKAEWGFKYTSYCNLFQTGPDGQK